MKAYLETVMKPPHAKSFRRPNRSRRPSRRLFAPERLEHRDLPSVAVPGIIATGPTDGSTVFPAPQSFTITFDPQVVSEVESTIAQGYGIDPDQVLPMLILNDLYQDVEIDQVGVDGSLTPYAGSTSTPVAESIATSTGPDGTTQTQLVVTLGPDAPAMQPGTYQLDVVPGTLLAWAFSNFTDPTWLTAPAPIPIAQFTVLGQGPTLAGATDLGEVGAQATSVWATLEPSNYQSAVALYRVTLPQGGLWQLEATALASAIGSPVLPALALFDQDGNLLAARQNGDGSSDSNPDPALAMNLPGGTYYLGVSAAHNVPGTPGGYDPITGRPGTDGVGEPAGVFELEVSATPSVPPPTVVGFNLDHEDPIDPSPTGMDLTFSGPIDLTPLVRPDQIVTALTVVDATGRAYAISPVNYDDSGHILSLTFDEPLPAGTYSLMEPSQGGLTDPTGQPVEGPAGNPPSVLATWTVAAPTSATDPNNIGVLWPGETNVTWGPATSRNVTIDAGQEVDERFVVICPGVYSLQDQVDAGSIDVRIAAADGATVLDSNNPAGLNRSLFWLTPGVYELQMSAEGAQGASAGWLLKPLALDYEKITTNGVSQAAAQSQPLFGPEPSALGAPTNSGSSAQSSTDVTAKGTTQAASSGAFAGVGGASTTGLASSAGAAPLLMTPQTNLAGMPGSEAWSVAAVGPLADGATVALADAGRLLPAGIRYQASRSGTVPRVGEGDLMAGAGTASPDPPADSGPALASSAGGPEAASARADAMAVALAQADPLVRIAGWLAGRIPGPSATPREPVIPATGLGATLLAAAASQAEYDDDGRARNQSRANLAQADLGVPFALLMGTALTYRMSRPVRKWWRRHHVGHPTWRRPYGLARSGLAVPRR
jgi:hypothetical protein